MIKTLYRRLYRKLYLYGFLSMIVALLLSTFLVAQSFKAMSERPFNMRLQEHVTLVQEMLISSGFMERPEATEALLKHMEKVQNWKLSIWQGENCLLHCSPESLAFTAKRDLRLPQNVQLFNGQQDEALALALLYETANEPVYLQARVLDQKHFSPFERPVSNGQEPRRQPPPHRGPEVLGIPPHILTVILLLILFSLALIPYVRYIVSPFKELSLSIDRVSEGDFNTLVPIRPKSEFAGIAVAFNEMVAKIQQMLQQRDRLITDVSHELRSPLARVRMSLELLDKEAKGNPKYIHKSIAEIEQLDEMIENILDASTLDLENNTYPLLKLNLISVAQDSLEKNQAMLEKHQFQIQSHFENGPLWIRGNPGMLDRVFNNLLSNIFKYAPQSSVIEISLKSESNAVVMTVRDFGPGIPEAELETVLEAFYRTDLSRSRKTGGSGLGLAIIQRIMQIHNGSIVLQTPEDGKGGVCIMLSWPQWQAQTTQNLELPTSI